VILYPFVFSFFVKAVCIDVEYMICCYRILSLSFSLFLSPFFSFSRSFLRWEGEVFFFLAVFFSCVCSFFFLFCFSLHSISICPFAMVYLGHGFFFFSCTDDFLLGGDLCASKCRLCLTPLVCVSWNGKAF